MASCFLYAIYCVFLRCSNDDHMVLWCFPGSASSDCLNHLGQFIGMMVMPKARMLVLLCSLESLAV